MYADFAPSLLYFGISQFEFLSVGLLFAAGDRRNYMGAGLRPIKEGRHLILLYAL